MKEWLGIRYPERKTSYNQLRSQVTEAWRAISETEVMNSLINSMHERCQDVINAEGGYTKW